MNINVIIDLVLAAIALIVIIKFTVRGFLRSVLDALKVVIAGVIAYLIRIPVANLIDGWFMRNAIVNWVRQSLNDAIAGNDTFVNFAELYEGLPELFSTVLAKFGLGDVSSLENLEVATGEQIEALATDIGSAISMLLSTVLAVIILFIIAIIVLTIVIKLLDGLMNFTAVRLINRALGFVLGIACAGLIVWAVNYALTYLIGATNGFGGKLTQEMLDNSMLISFIKMITQQAN